jgi:hypothetical protein
MSLDVYLYPPKCPHCGRSDERFCAGVTHNLRTMAIKARIYKPVWRPEEVGITKAKQLQEPLAKAIARLRKRPDVYKKYNPPNGWGDYEGFVAFLEEYLAATQAMPEATVEVSR